jgi:anti-anti-sigma factor
MKFDEERIGDVVVLTPRGDMDVTTLPAFEARVAAMLVQGARGLLWDLVHVRILPSTAVGFLLGAAKRVRAAGGRTAVARAGRLATTTLRTTGLTEILPLYAGREEALADLAAP